MDSLKYFVSFCNCLFLITLSIGSNAQPIDFSGKLDLIVEDSGSGVYSGVPLGTLFTGSISPLTGGGEISDGNKSTTFSCCIAAGGLSIDNDESLDAETASLLNSLTGSSSFSAGQILDLVDIEGDVATAGGGRIEIGLSYILSSDAFDDNSLGNYPFDPSKVLLSVFFIVEEDDDGEDIYSAIGQLLEVIPASERDALLSLFASAGGASWNSNSGWDPSPASVGTECTWTGVTCSGHRVIELDLMSNNLVGTIPPELGNLTNLELLRLASNNLTGGIPSELGNISTLRQLDVSFNLLAGSIPAELANPMDLDLLLVNDNQLSGQVPQILLDDLDLNFSFTNNPG
ncbi:MAG: hypothetical protein KJN90_00965, partial [Gammaproteobacteria bacterium]|nr:hypothetical protein [Gammaproteobacteria bacterium]